MVFGIWYTNLMKKLLLVLIAFLFVSTTLASPTFAALKKSQKIIVSAYRTTRDVRAIFSNVKYAKKISYELSYQRAGGISDGAGGTIIPKGKSITKIFTLGSCSTGNVCTYHKGVKNIKLKVTTWYSPSLTVETKTYSIK